MRARSSEAGQLPLQMDNDDQETPVWTRGSELNYLHPITTFGVWECVVDLFVIGYECNFSQHRVTGNSLGVSLKLCVVAHNLNLSRKRYVDTDAVPSH